MDSDLCICGGQNPVTWPRVCDACIDHAAQAELALQYGYQVSEGPFGEVIGTTGMECRTCGLIYDGGNFCTYCGDRNPLGEY